MKTHLNHINTQKVRYTFEEMTTESLNQFFLHQDVSRSKSRNLDSCANKLSN